RVLSGQDCTKQGFAREAAKADFIHITTHMLLRQENPMFSSLQFGESSMSPLDLYAMSCQANLVTIGGSKSGFSETGAGQDQLAVVRAFLYAGARSLMISLWDAPARSRAMYYREMYSAWKNAGCKRAAMKEAAEVVRDAHPHPFHWAPF